MEITAPREVCFGGTIFMQAFPRECTKFFLEGHKRAFEFFGGVPNRISYDHSNIAVACLTGYRERKVTTEFSRLKSHFMFEDHFCLVICPNEKGHVERLLDFSRRNFLVPVPSIDSLERLNEQLWQCCQEDLKRQLRGKPSAKSVLLKRTDLQEKLSLNWNQISVARTSGKHNPISDKWLGNAEQ